MILSTQTARVRNTFDDFKAVDYLHDAGYKYLDMADIS